MKRGACSLKLAGVKKCDITLSDKLSDGIANIAAVISWPIISFISGRLHPFSQFGCFGLDNITLVYPFLPYWYFRRHYL